METQATLTPFSGLVITYNEEKHIGACLESLGRVCGDIVVIDSQSQDNTVRIAEEMGATVLVQPFLGDGPQRSFGLPHCNNNWIIYLDADERLDQDFIDEIAQLDAANDSIEAYECRRKNFYNDRWIKVAGQYPDYICRVFDKTKTDFSPDKIHARIETDKLAKLDGHILHYSFNDLSDMIHRLNRYTDWHRDALLEKNKKVSVFSPIGHGFAAFIKFYFLRRGFLAGFDGFNIAMLNALGSYFKYAKVLERQRKNNL